MLLDRQVAVVVKRAHYQLWLIHHQLHPLKGADLATVIQVLVTYR